MRPARQTLLLVLGIAFLLTTPGAGLAEEPAQTTEEEWAPVPFRVRDLTFPTVLVMGFMPRPTNTLEQGAWALELNYSASNNFQVSDDIEAWLTARGGPRSPLSQEDVDQITSELDGSQFYIDGEFSVFDLNLHYGIGPRTSVSVRASYLSYSGGFLDPVIYSFHDTLGIGQAGRDHVANGSFQMLFMDGDEPYVLLDRPTSGGFTDPVLSLSHTFPATWAGWTFSGETAVKIPVADEDTLLSTGSFDIGLQLTGQRQWRSDAVVLNLAYVIPGTFQPTTNFDPPHLPSLNVAYLHRFGGRTTFVFQALFSENIFRDAVDSDLSAFEFQYSIGVKVRALGGLIGVGLTENLFNFDNTPDFGLHLSYGVAFD